MCKYQNNNCESTHISRERVKKYQRGNIGEKYILSDGSECVVIDGGVEPGLVTIKYATNKIKEARITHLRISNVKNEFNANIYGKGYVGVGEYKTTINGRPSKIYSIWHSMLARCYSNDSHIITPTYNGCEVSKEWYSFQNFADWYEDNYREFEDSRSELDKDIIGDGKLYSPETCCIIPHKLNCFMINNQSSNTSGHTGVFHNKSNGKFNVNISDCENGKYLYLGTFDTLKEASATYKQARKTQCVKMRKMCINKWNITDKRILNGIE